jgi:hypothetical protein
MHLFKIDFIILTSIQMTESVNDKLQLLLMKYDYTSNQIDTDGSDSANDMTHAGILLRENTHLKKVVENQRDIIDIFRTKYQDLAIEYNNKIENLRDSHLQELEDIHSQFKDRLRKERDKINERS